MNTSLHPHYTNILDLTQLNIIGLTGHAGVGKDTVAEYLETTYTDTYTEAFADPLKQACAAAFGIDPSEFYDPDVKEEINKFWGVSPRQIAQFVGSELFRDSIWKLLPNDRADFWVRKMYAKLSGAQLDLETSGIYEPGDTVVITDCRFQNEYDFIVANEGIVIHISRPGFSGKVGLTNHQSEAGIKNFHDRERTYLVNNDSDLDSLFAQVDTIIQQSNLKLTRYKLPL